MLESARRFHQVSAWLVERVRNSAAPDEAKALTAWRYARMRAYLADWHRELGLFDFERAALDGFFPAPPAHLLVHGAGGGREAHALLARGHRVTAAEPVVVFAEALRDALGASAVVVRAGIEDPASPDLAGPFEGIIVGWGAYGHLLDAETRVRALRTLRQSCPDGPILLSWRHSLTPGLRGTAQNEEEAAGRRPPWQGAAVSHFGLFHAVLDEASVRTEADAAGSRVAFFGGYGDAGYPNAVLLPSRPRRDTAAS